MKAHTGLNTYRETIRRIYSRPPTTTQTRASQAEGILARWVAEIAVLEASAWDVPFLCAVPSVFAQASHCNGGGRAAPVGASWVSTEESIPALNWRLDWRIELLT